MNITLNSEQEKIVANLIATGSFQTADEVLQVALKLLAAERQTWVEETRKLVQYFAGVNVEVGEKFLQGFSNRCKQIANFPNIGRSYDDLQVGLRGLPLDVYIIFYRTTGDDLEIVRVVNGRQDLRALFDSLN
jgi:toxin ParE1/3/4